MTDKHQLTDEEIKALAQKRAEALKRVQEMRAKTHHPQADAKGGGAHPKQGPPKGRNFRHQGR